MEESKVNYNEEPVYYCKKCLSLRIRNIPSIENSEYCDDCNSTDIGVCSIEEWERMYKEAHHGVSYLNNKY